MGSGKQCVRCEFVVERPAYLSEGCDLLHVQSYVAVGCISFDDDGGAKKVAVGRCDASESITSTALVLTCITATFAHARPCCPIHFVYSSRRDRGSAPGEFRAVTALRRLRDILPVPYQTIRLHRLSPTPASQQHSVLFDPRLHLHSTCEALPVLYHHAVPATCFDYASRRRTDNLGHRYSARDKSIA